MRISDWSSDVCSSDLGCGVRRSTSAQARRRTAPRLGGGLSCRLHLLVAVERCWQIDGGDRARRTHRHLRSEEHTSELQSLMRISYAVFCLKKKKKKHKNKLTYNKMMKSYQPHL